MAGKATRASFGEALVELGEKNPRVVAMDADLSKSTKSDGFAKAYPDRFFQMGISEANMIGAAAGMAFAGKVPFICSFGAFLTGRFDTIRLSIGYSNANVRLVGTHSGIGIGEDGYSQMALEDIACMRTLPGLAVIQPADHNEAKQVVHFLGDYQGPVYLRLTRQNLPDVNGADYKFEFGKGVELKTGGKDAVVFATGGVVGNSLEAANMLEKEGFKVGVVNIHTIKPIDTEIITRLSSDAAMVFTAEDHNVIGGLGSAVAEVVTEAGLGKRVTRLGVQDTYGESGSPAGLYEKHSLDSAGLARSIKSVLNR